MDMHEEGCVAIFATAGTVSSNGYVDTFRDLQREGEYTGDVDVFQQAGIGIAGAVDGASEYIMQGTEAPRDGYKGPSEIRPEARIDLSILPRYDFEWGGGAMLYEGDRENPRNLQINSVRNYIAYHVVSLMERIRVSSDAKPLKVVILGCTHYPFYTDVFAEELERLFGYQEEGVFIYRPFLAEAVVIIDPAENTARELYAYLAQKRMFDDGDLCRSEFYVSVPNVLNDGIAVDGVGNFTYAYKYGRESGVVQEYVKRVPFSRWAIPDAVVQRLAEKIPSVYRLLTCFTEDNPKTAYLGEEKRF
jgi:hypothetical protein